MIFDESLLDKKFLRLAINQNLDDYIHQAHGGAGLAHITKGMFEDSELRIPPLAEQRRIVAQVEALLARVHAARARLAKVPALLKRFRKSVLAAACSGQLTADWRESESALEPISLQVQRISAAREAHHHSRASGDKRKRPAPVAIDTGDLPPAPEEWCWQSADAVCAQITDGEHIQPPYQSHGRPMLTATHVRDGYVEFKDYGSISEEDFSRCLKRCAPQENDVLIVSVGATTGRAAVVHNCPPFAIVRSVLLLRPLLEPQYFLRWVQSSWCFQWMTQASGASAQPHLYISDTKRMPVPVPPVAEQHEIIRRVDALFALADKIEARVATATARVAKITPAILAKAFRGELVPTEAELARAEGRDYEPASVLLERIRAERADSERRAALTGRQPKVKARKSGHRT